MEEELVENLTRLTVTVQVRRSSETSQASRRSTDEGATAATAPTNQTTKKKQPTPAVSSISQLGRKAFIEKKIRELKEVKKRGPKHPFNRSDITRGVNNQNRTDEQVEKFLNFLTDTRTPTSSISVWESDFRDLSAAQRKWIRNYAENKENSKWTGVGDEKK